MFLLFDLELGAVREGPFDDIRLFACAFDEFALGDCGPAAVA